MVALVIKPMAIFMADLVRGGNLGMITGRPLIMERVDILMQEIGLEVTQAQIILMPLAVLVEVAELPKIMVLPEEEEVTRAEVPVC